MAAPAAQEFWNGDALPIYGDWDNDQVVNNLRYRSMFNSAAIASTIVSGSNVPGPWHGIECLGSGGSGQAVLYARFDAANAIRERLVVKKVQCAASDWYTPMKWPGPTDGNDDRNYNAGMNHSQSMETLIHRKLSRRRCNALLEYIGHSPVEQKHWRYRLFTQYADQGALDEVISYYRQHVREAPEWWNPEAFIWYCFQNLARAARVMECGDETLPEVSGWRSVVHRDIKPGNVLLQSPATYWTCSTVAAKLSDMDLAVETSTTDPNNPRAYQDAGTPGVFAPEQIRWINSNTRSVHDTPPMKSATNVFAIGLVYRVLSPGLDFSDGESVQMPLPPTGFPIGGAKYSATWTDLMRECLRYNPSERPSLSYILDTIEPRGLTADDMHFKGMRTAKLRGNTPWYDMGTSIHHLRGFNNDVYRIGLARGNTQPPRVPLPWRLKSCPHGRR
ncbi:hypothetical protein CLAFUW4_04244 [Fulvia fulva]|nr:hypothetical protein CLAFUR4_04230 [Fulvia fulva]WPV13886.1 hypothetical protein CLAFUW4_04244 [Fulvia fulva]WPV28979.1 hypothetical protein CLAFUW7_04233 [Fulvia fulva]